MVFNQFELDPGNNRKKNLMIGCIYRHPNSNLYLFTEKFDDLLKHLNQCEHDVYILRDLKVHQPSTHRKVP